MRLAPPALCRTALAVLAALLLLTSLAFSQPSPSLRWLTPAETAELEARALEGRLAYWEGRWEEAATLFRDLAAGQHTSAGLYWRELAMVELALGNKTEAKQALLEAVAFSERHSSAELERSALRAHGRESMKVYAGDPYEQAASWLLLALLFLDDGDLDNALACCKSGLLADTDASENRFESDFTLLYLLESRIHTLRGDAETAAELRERARTSYRLTHPSIREQSFARHDLIASLRLSPRERERAGWPREEAAVHQQIALLDAEIEQFTAGLPVDEELGALLNGDYDLLVVGAHGRGPWKKAAGDSREKLVFDLHRLIVPQPRLLLHDGQPGAWHWHLADLDYQATTRGGRRMDAILRGQAQFRQGALNVGAELVRAGNDGNTAVHLAFVLIGIAVQGVASGINPDADIRGWGTLPSQLMIAPLRAGMDGGAIGFGHRIYFEEGHRGVREFRSGAGVRVVFVPPTPLGRYSEGAALATSERRRRPEPELAGPSVLVPPVQGMRLLEPIPGMGQGRRVVAPDVWQWTRRIARSARAQGWNARDLSHDEACRDPAPGIEFALQTEFVGARGWHQDTRSEGVELHFRFKWIHLPSATTLHTHDSRVTRVLDAQRLRQLDQELSLALDEAIADWWASLPATASVPAF